MPFPRDTLQRVGATILEIESRPGHQILHGARDKHLAGFSKGSDTGADVHGDPAELRAHQLALASVEASPHSQAEALDAGTHGGGGAHGAGGSIEGCDETVATGVDLSASELREFLTHNGMMRLEEAAPVPIADLSRFPCRLHDVGEEDRRRVRGPVPARAEHR